MPLSKEDIKPDKADKAEPELDAEPAPDPGVEMAKEPVIAPDGHQNLTQEDLDNRLPAGSG